MTEIQYGKSIAIFKNVDETILKLNPYLSSKKFRFEAVPISLIKTDYGSLFLPKGLVNIDNETFYEIYRNHLFGVEFPSYSDHMYLLINDTPIKYEWNDNHYSPNETWKLSGATQRFKEELIRKLRFFKKGDIHSPAQFTILDESRKIMHAVYNGYQRVTNYTKFNIEDKDVAVLEDFLEKDFESTDLTKIAEIYFQNSYEVNDYNIKFINLITALESVFNSSNTQIVQVLSRHLAILISENEEEFKKNFARVKKLYVIRSKLIHGQTLNVKEKIEDLVDEVYNLNRTVLIKCMELGLNKKELFEYLNIKGF